MAKIKVCVLVLCVLVLGPLNALETKVIPFTGFSGFFPFNAHDIGLLNPSDTIRVVLSWSNALSV